MQNSDFWTRITSLYVYQPSSVVLCIENSDLRTKNCMSLWVPALTCGFVHAKQRDFRTRITSLYGSQTHSCGFCMQNSDFWTRITSLYGSQTWPVILCMYNSVISTRITSLYRSQPLSVVLCIQNSDLMTRIACLYGSQTSPVRFSECKTACLASEILVSMGPSSHLWFLDANQPLLDQKCMSQWVPELTCDFLHAKQRA